MTLRNVPKSRIAIGTILVLLGFAGLYLVFDADNLIILLNGCFAGSLVAIGLAYRRLLLDALIGDGLYDRYRQMTFSIFLQWVVICIGVATSIYVNAANLPEPAFLAIAFARYLATVTAFIQITSPYVGGKFVAGDKLLISTSLGIGAVVAVILIWLQGV